MFMRVIKWKNRCEGLYGDCLVLGLRFSRLEGECSGS